MAAKTIGSSVLSSGTTGVTRAADATRFNEIASGAAVALLILAGVVVFMTALKVDPNAQITVGELGLTAIAVPP